MNIDEQHEALSGRGVDRSTGARVEMRDSRFTHLIGWASLTVGGMFVSGLLWIATTLVGIKESMASMAATMGEQTKTLTQRIERNDALDDRQEQHINSIDGRVYTLEGRNLRGAPQERRNER